MVKKILLTFLAFTQIINCSDKLIEIKKEDLKTAEKKHKPKIVLGILDKNINSQTIDAIAKCLKLNGEFDIDTKNLEPIKNNQDLTNLYNQGYILAIFISEPSEQNFIEWRLYDLIEKKMVSGKKVSKIGSDPRWHGYNLVDNAYPFLMGQESPFSSQIAYIKKDTNVRKKNKNIVCCSDIEGIKETTLIPDHGIYVGSYWHFDNKNPRLFCSEFTKSNVRLISTDMHRNKQVVINLPGTCVGVSLAKNNDAVYCRSGQIWHYKYNLETKTGTHKQIIKNDGKNLYPTLLENGDIIFCSDSKDLSKSNKKTPHIYKYIKDTDTTEKIIDSGYCLCPAYSNINNKLAYSKKINGIFQLYILDLKSKKETTITSGEGNKIDPSWSSCGNYLTYCYQKNKISRIAIINVNTKNNRFITSDKSHCSSPSWSPKFAIFEYNN